MSDVSSSTARVARFGAFELDVRSGELRKSGARVPLQHQPRQILTSLLERPGDVITRDELRQRLWPDDTFVDFEHGLNAAVKRLRETLRDSADTPRFVETLPRRGYRFIAPVEWEASAVKDAARAIARPGSDAGNARVSDVAARAEHPARPARGVVATGILGVLIAAAAFVWLSRPSPAKSDLPPRIVPLTLLTGFEGEATFSPDDTQFAFMWTGDTENPRGIYVSLVGSTEVRRLTSEPVMAANPKWSPDGKRIAYLRRLHPEGAEYRVHLMSALGGFDRELSDFLVRRGISWSPDGRFIVAAASSRGIYLIPVDGGEPRAILRPTAQEVLASPAISPDGRTLAYASCDEPIFATNCYLLAVDVDAAFTPTGPSRRLTPRTVWRIQGPIAWSRNGQYVVYPAEPPYVQTLWRVRVDGKQPPARIELAGIQAVAPAMGNTGARLAFTRLTYYNDVYRVDAGGAARPVASSSVFDSNPQLSPDGRQFAFCSTRSGEAVEVWIADADGTKRQQLTHGPSTWQCSPTWSPDGRRIAFDSRTEDGDWRVWTIDVDGRRLRQITNEPGSQNMPTWSRDGQWIYFSWDHGGERDIWRVHVVRGTRERVTRGGGGLVGRESADGQSLLYQPHTFDSAVVAQPLGGGAARSVVPCVTGTAYAVLPQGIYYIPCQTDLPRDPNPPVHVRDPVTGEERPAGVLQDYAYGNVPSGFAVSPDGRSMFYGRETSVEGDVMMIENYR